MGGPLCDLAAARSIVLFVALSYCDSAMMSRDHDQSGFPFWGEFEERK